MNCMDFQKIMPDIIHNKIEDEHIEEVIKHFEECKECRDEFEIYFVLNYGMSDEHDDDNSNFVERIDTILTKMKSRLRHYSSVDTLIKLVNLCAYTSVVGAFIYVFFEIIMK